MKVSDEEIVSALLTSSTNEQAAKKIGLSVTQLYRRMKTEAFKNRYSVAKQQIFEIVLEKAQLALSEALDTMIDVMRDQNSGQQIKLNAAVALVNTATRLQKSANLEKEAFQEWEYV